MAEKRRDDEIEFDDLIAVRLAAAVDAGAPGAHVKERLMAKLAEAPEVPGSNDIAVLPRGFRFDFEATDGWVSHPVPGIRMRVLSLNRERDYATLLLDVAPGTRFPPHHHDGAEECYIVSGSAYTFGQRMGPGDFLHADAGTDHGELYTEEGCRVILIVRPEDYMV